MRTGKAPPEPDLLFASPTHARAAPRRDLSGFRSDLPGLERVPQALNRGGEHPPSLVVTRKEPKSPADPPTSYAVFSPFPIRTFLSSTSTRRHRRALDCAAFVRSGWHIDGRRGMSDRGRRESELSSLRRRPHSVPFSPLSSSHNPITFLLLLYPHTHPTPIVTNSTPTRLAFPSFHPPPFFVPCA